MTISETESSIPGGHISPNNIYSSIQIDSVNESLQNELFQIDDVTHAEIASFRRLISSNEQASDETTGSVLPSLEHVQMVLSSARIEQLALDYYRAGFVKYLDGIRSSLLLVPVLLTWLSLSLASAAFRSDVELLASQNSTSTPSFQQLWEQGFISNAVGWGPFKSLPLEILYSDGHVWRWFTFSSVAGADAFIIALIIILMAVSGVLNNKVDTKVRRITEYVERQSWWIISSISRLTTSARDRAMLKSLGSLPETSNQAFRSFDGLARQLKLIIERQSETSESFSQAVLSTERSSQNLQHFSHLLDQDFVEQRKMVAGIETSLSQLIAVHETGNEFTHNLIAVLVECKSGINLSARVIESASSKLEESARQVGAALEELVSHRNEIRSMREQLSQARDRLDRSAEVGNAISASLLSSLATASEQLIGLTASLNDVTGEFLAERATMQEVDATIKSTLKNVMSDLNQNLVTVTERLSATVNHLETGNERLSIDVSTVISNLQQLAATVADFSGHAQAAVQASLRSPADSRITERRLDSALYPDMP